MALRIMICTMEDPVYTVPFISDVLRARAGAVCALVLSRRGRMTVGRKRSRVGYAASLLLIMGPGHFAATLFRAGRYRVRTLLAERWGIGLSPSLSALAKELGIPVLRPSGMNDPDFIETMRELAPDVVINQTQDILKREFLSIPRLGVLNRHNALLPRHRGRVSPFWALYHGDERTGVTIHFVDEGIDSGEIIVQQAFDVAPADDFNSVVRRCYRIAPAAMLEALEVLEKGAERPRIANDDAGATYNTLPTFFEALRYRLNRIRRAFTRRVQIPLRSRSARGDPRSRQRRRTHHQ